MKIQLPGEPENPSGMDRATGTYQMKRRRRTMPQDPPDSDPDVATPDPSNSEPDMEPGSSSNSGPPKGTPSGSENHLQTAMETLKDIIRKLVQALFSAWEWCRGKLSSSATQHTPAGTSSKEKVDNFFDNFTEMCVQDIAKAKAAAMESVLALPEPLQEPAIGWLAKAMNRVGEFFRSLLAVMKELIALLKRAARSAWGAILWAYDTVARECATRINSQIRQMRPELACPILAK